MPAETSIVPDLVITVPAEVDRLRGVRYAMERWLAETGASDDLRQDVVLAVYEAMANSVEHAFLGGRSGHINLTAHVDGRDIVVSVSDDGHWRASTPAPNRGRGLALIRAAARRVDIVGGDGRTSVTARFALR